MASRSVRLSPHLLSRAAHLLLRHNYNKPTLSNPLFQDLSLKTLTNPQSQIQTLKPFSSSFTISNHNLFFSHSRSFCSSFEPNPLKLRKLGGGGGGGVGGVNSVELDSSSAISQGEPVKRKPGRPRKNRLVDEMVSLESSTSPLSSLSQTQKRGRGRPPGSGKKKEVELESSPVSSPLSSSLLQTQKRGRGRPPGSGKKKEVELELPTVSFPLSSSLSQTQKRGRGRPPGSGKKKEVELELPTVSFPLSSSLSQTQKRGRGRPPGSGKKKEVELESSPVSSPLSSSLSQTQKRGRGRPPGSGKKKEMLKQQSLKEGGEQEQGEPRSKYKKEERELKEDPFMFQRAFLESAAFVCSHENRLNPWEDFLKVRNKRDLPCHDISYCYMDEGCLIIE